MTQQEKPYKLDSRMDVIGQNGNEGTHYEETPIDKRYICYIKREDRMEEPKTITVTEKELIDLIEEGKEVQGYRMDQIEMITTKEEDK
jgi:hypothetical protein